MTNHIIWAQRPPGLKGGPTRLVHPQQSRDQCEPENRPMGSMNPTMMGSGGGASLEAMRDTPAGRTLGWGGSAEVRGQRGGSPYPGQGG